MISQDMLVDFPDPFAGNASLPKWFMRVIPSKAFRNDDLIARIALEVDRTLRPDLLMVFQPGIDKTSHFLWGAFEPAELYSETLQFSEVEREANIAAMEATYAYTDRLIGAVLEGFGPNDLVMVVSDHGFEAREMLKHNTTGGHDTEAAVDGVIFARGPGVPKASSIRGMSVNDVTPTVLAWLGLPVARDMDGRPAPFLELPAREPVASYDTTPIERMGEGSSPAEPALLERLRALGYLE